MIKLLSNLLGRSGIVKNEVIDLANSATRIGSLLEDIARAGIFKYDPAQAYEAGQSAVKDGLLIECVIDAAPNEGPDTTAGKPKWSVKLVLDEAQVNESNHLPISASAVFKYVQGKIFGNDTPENASTTKRGIVRQATDAEFANAANINFEGVVSNDTYTTPMQVGGLFKTISDGIQAITGISLNKALQGGADSGITPYFDGGIVATLPGVPEGITTKPVVVGPDGTLYNGDLVVVTPPPATFSFTGGVHYEAVPVDTEIGTQPRLGNPTADWAITTRGVSTKVLGEDEFIVNPTAIYNLQALLFDGGANSVSPLPNWITFDKATRTLTANVTADVVNTDFIIRIIKSDQSGSGVPDDFLMTLRVPAITCANYFKLTDAQFNALPMTIIYEYINRNVSMAPNVTWTVRSFSSKAELLASIVPNGINFSLDFCRGTTQFLNIGDTLYGDNRVEHVIDGTYNYWPAEAGFWGFNYTAPTQSATGSIVIVQTSPCGIVVTREQVTLQFN